MCWNKVNTLAGTTGNPHPSHGIICILQREGWLLRRETVDPNRDLQWICSWLHLPSLCQSIFEFPSALWLSLPCPVEHPHVPHSRAVPQIWDDLDASRNDMGNNMKQHEITWPRKELKGWPCCRFRKCFKIMYRELRRVQNAVHYARSVRTGFVCFFETNQLDSAGSQQHTVHHKLSGSYQMLQSKMIEQGKTVENKTTYWKDHSTKLHCNILQPWPDPVIASACMCQSQPSLKIMKSHL